METFKNFAEQLDAQRIEMINEYNTLNLRVKLLRAKMGKALHFGREDDYTKAFNDYMDDSAKLHGLTTAIQQIGNAINHLGTDKKVDTFWG